MIDDARVARFARQLLVPGFGEAAQERLGAARVRAVGADRVASTALVYLACAGVGRLWIEDPAVVSDQDLGGGLYAPQDLGRPRVEAAREALARLSRFVEVEAYPTGGVPSATLVAVRPVAQALQSAEAARRAGIPHVVVEADADGGTVVTIPPGAPCYACSRTTGGAGRPPAAGVEALSALAAQELVLLVAGLPGIDGRRVDLFRGVATSRPTARLAGCACAAGSSGER